MVCLPSLWYPTCMQSLMPSLRHASEEHKAQEAVEGAHVATRPVHKSATLHMAHQVRLALPRVQAQHQLQQAAASSSLWCCRGALLQQLGRVPADQPGGGPESGSMWSVPSSA